MPSPGKGRNFIMYPKLFLRHAPIALLLVILPIAAVLGRALFVLGNAVDGRSALPSLLWQSAGALLLALLLAVWFRRCIAQELRDVDRTIRNIGNEGRLEAVTVMGLTDQEDLGRRLAWLRRRLSEMEDQRSRFLRHISHDLKTPLTAIIEGTQLLADGVPGELGAPQSRIVGIIGHNSQRLLTLIGDLLRYQQALLSSRLAAVKRVSLDAICLGVLQTHQVVAQNRGIRLHHSLTPILVDGEEEKLRVVVDNLLTNALKFCQAQGEVSVRLRADAAARVAVLDVIDDGPGVPEDERRQIFDAFFRGARVKQGQIAGSGLGLAIAKDYVLAHRGHIKTVARNNQTGAHFRVTLPLRRKPEEGGDAEGGAA